MTLEHYNPTGSEILFKEIREERTASGIIIPDAGFILKEQHNFWETEKVVYDGSKSKLGKYEVVKVGDACATIRPGDVIVLRTNSMPETIELDDTIYFQIMGAYVIGYERK